MPSRRACCSPAWRNARSTCSTSSGTATRSARCCGRRCGRPPNAACACACWSTTPTTPGSTRCSRRSTRTRTSSCACTTPSSNRGSRVIGYLTDFSRLNRRMHNKSFTADNQVSVVGGRNIADEYFGAAEGLGFADLDVMAIGPVVQEVSREFDLYWNSASAYPAAPFVGPPPADPAAVLQPRFEAVPQDPRAALYLQAVRQAPFVQELLERRLEFDWATGQVLYDNPAKTLDASADSDLILLPVLMRRMGSPQQRLDIISPYFVPGAVGTEHAGRHGPARRAGARADQFAGLVGRACRARRLPEAAHGPAARRRAAVRAEAGRRQVFAARARPLRAGQGLGAARQGLRRGRQAHLRRLVQLRPALGAPEHRDGAGDRQPDGREAAGRRLRDRGARHRLRSCASRPTAPTCSGSSAPRRAGRWCTTSIPRPARGNACRSASWPACRSIGCFDRGGSPRPIGCVSTAD